MILTKRQKGVGFLCMFAIGGFSYNLLELVWRGYSHWSMFFVGGTCFHLIGRIGGRLWCRGRLVVSIACSAAVTFTEFFSGCLLNLRWRLHVWDYSHMFGNVLGQVCLLYSVLWGGLSVIAVPLYRWMNGRIAVRLSSAHNSVGSNR